MLKKLSWVTLLVATAVLGSGMVMSSAPQTPTEETLDLSDQRMQFKEGLNPIKTTSEGYQLFAVVQKGEVIDYVVQDQSGNEVDVEKHVAKDGAWKICWKVTMGGTSHLYCINILSQE